MPDAANTTAADTGAATAAAGAAGNGASAATTTAAASTTNEAATGAAAAASTGAAAAATGAAATGTAAATGAATTAAAAAAAVELALPKDALVPVATLDQVKAFAKEHNLAPAVAQKVLDGHNAAVVSHQASEVAKYQAQVAQWQTEQKADKEIGGEHYDANIAMANRVLQSFASEKLIKDLGNSGLIHQPELVRMLVRIGKASSEDSLHGRGAGGGQQVDAEQAALRARYPSMFEKSA